MLVSIITVCYNRENTISKTIDSVLKQSYPNIEYIVIDGGSSDRTKEIISSYGSKISKFISEPDNGMYEAINKGLKLATGNIIGLMHSDDEFYANDVVEKIVSLFKNNPHSQGVYGNGVYVSNDEHEKLIRNRICGDFSMEKVKSGWLPLHPTVYLRSDIKKRFGYYDIDYKIASDTELLLRYLLKHQIKLIYLNEYIVKMRMGGLSTSRKKMIKIFKEDFRIYKSHGLSAFRSVFQKKILAIKQYIV
jgi:glycosyltransferase